MPDRAYTPADDVLLMRLRLAGWSTCRIARRLGRAPSSVDRRITRLVRDDRLDPDPDDLRRARERGGPAWRTCLGPTCRGERAFASTDKGNRLCEGCRDRVAYAAGALSYD
jgi:hypothetical protein